MDVTIGLRIGDTVGAGKRAIQIVEAAVLCVDHDDVLNTLQLRIGLGSREFGRGRLGLRLLGATDEQRSEQCIGQGKNRGDGNPHGAGLWKFGYVLLNKGPGNTRRCRARETCNVDKSR